MPSGAAEPYASLSLAAGESVRWVLSQRHCDWVAAFMRDVGAMLEPYDGLDAP